MISRSILIPFIVCVGCAGSSQVTGATQASEPAPVAASAPAGAPNTATAQAIASALAGPHRSEKNRARDVYRHRPKRSRSSACRPNHT